MKLLFLNGEILEKAAGETVFVALVKSKEGYWSVSGTFYHSPDQVLSGLTWSAPDEIVIVKVIIPNQVL